MDTMFYVILGIVAVMFIFGIVLACISISKGLKQTKIISKEVKEDTEDETGNIFKDLGKRIRESVEEIANPNLTCPYCKTTYSRKESKCPSCGAGKPKK